MTLIKKFFKKREIKVVSEVKPSNPVGQSNSVVPQPEAKQADKTSHAGVMNVSHLIVLDESGSMCGVTAQTISGCNETLQTIREMQKKNPTDQYHLVSIFAFDTENSRYIRKNQDIDNVPELTGRDYSPNGGTPLFDAMGDTLTELRTKVDGKDSIGYVTIITDGYENASRRYSMEDVQRLIDELKQKGVIFSFIGANIDAADYARTMHIDNAMQFEQTMEGTQEMWQRERRSKMRSNARMQMFRKYEDDDLEEFYREENEGKYYSEAPEERVTPDFITSLRPNEIFVFGSDIHGSHNGGAAKFAVEKFGAIRGKAAGPQGQSYAITTLGVSEEELFRQIVHFYNYAKSNPQLTFYVTPIGCGTAGWLPYTIAPMFHQAAGLPNVKLPRLFWDYCSE